MRPKPPKKTQTELNAAFWELPDDALVDRAMAGAVAHLGKKSMELLAMKGGGPPYSVNGKALYRKGDVVEWLRKRTHTIEVTAQRQQSPRKNLKSEISSDVLAMAQSQLAAFVGADRAWQIPLGNMHLAELKINRWLCNVPVWAVAKDLHLKPEPFAKVAHLMSVGDDVRAITGDQSKIIDLVCVRVTNKGKPNAIAVCHVTGVTSCAASGAE